MGMKEGVRTLLVHAPKEAIADMDLPPLDIATRRGGQFEYIHLFIKTKQEFTEQFPKLKEHLAPTGKLWVSWPKNGQLNTDLSLTTIIHLGYDYDLVESTCLSINSTWSALKFTHPKRGKTYHNKYGKLPE